jgi:YVTN family beta-propeller protein
MAGRLLPAMLAAGLIAACGGGGDPLATSAQATPTREKAQYAFSPSTPIPADANQRGMWSGVLPWPLIGIHVALLPDGRVLSYGTDTAGRQTGYFSYDVWDPQGGLQGGHLTLANNTGTDLFCSATLLLPGGQEVLLTGGDNWTGTSTTNTGSSNTNVFKVGTNTLARGNEMHRPRWYATTTTLLDGRTYIQGGTGGTDRPEVRDTGGAFRLLAAADTASLFYYYPRNFVAPDGRIFGFDGSGRMYYVDAKGDGSISMQGQFGSAYRGFDSSAAMFRPGRILQFGGNSNGAIVIDIRNGAPVITPTASMSTQRKGAVATLLPNGRVLATGGSSVWNTIDSPSVVSVHAEIWSSDAGTWTVGASAAKPRLYHSGALLLPDATVLVIGGGAPGPLTNLNAELYFPPYLFAPGGTLAARPVIDAAPTTIDIGSTFSVSVSGSAAPARVVMIKTGAVTHGFNMDQRFVELPFVAQGAALSVQAPTRAADAPPGFYLLFVLDAAGVPSVARMVRVNVAGAASSGVPTLARPSDQSGTVGIAASLQLVASDPTNDPLTYNAVGLPPGLSIDSRTGLISGKPTTGGTFNVVASASDGALSASANFSWVVGAARVMQVNLPTMPGPAVVGSTITYTASVSGGVNPRFEWDFGDGTATTYAATPSATHAYAKPGLFFVTLTAIDDTGAMHVQTMAQPIHLLLTASRPTASSNLATSAGVGGSNDRVWVVNQDNDSVAVFDAVTRGRLAEIPVGRSPRSLAVGPGGMVWVTNKRSATISVIDPATLKVGRTLQLPRGSQPFGIAINAAGGHALVVLEAGGQLLKISTSTYAVTGRLDIGANARQVSITGDGANAYVTRYITPPLPGEGTSSVQTAGAGAEVLTVDPASMTLVRTVRLAHSDRADAEQQGRGIPNYLGPAVVSPDGVSAWVPSKQDNVKRGLLRAGDGTALNFQNTVRAVSSRLVVATGAEDPGDRIDHDNAGVASAAAFDARGLFLFVALETSREVAVISAHGRTQLFRFDVGRAPDGLALSRDGRTLYVNNFMDRTIGVYDISPLVDRAEFGVFPQAILPTVGSEKLAAGVLLGKRLFYDARDPRLARDRYLSCAACHNDGGHDGRVWDFAAQGEGLRNTVSLRGRAGAHGHLHWSNNFDEVQDFEGQIRGLAGGAGLMTNEQFATGTRSRPLGDRKAGVSADLDALAAYLASLDAFDPSPHRQASGALSALAGEGKAVFTNLGCAACHVGAAFSKSGVDNPENIGTIKATSGQRLGGPLTGIDVPTLRDVWATAPYLHDGSAPTLEAAVRAHAGLLVDDADLSRLLAYLREIGSDEASAPAPAGGLAASYFNNVTLTGTAALTRVEAVDFNWGRNAPGAGVSADNFSARWTGRLAVPTTGAYAFQTESDDGVRLWVNGQKLVDNWTDHSARLDTSSTVSLNAGTQVDIVMEYYERGGDAVARLRWRPPGASSFVAVPASQLSPLAAAPQSLSQGLTGRYYGGVSLGGSPLLTRTEAVDFDWRKQSPGPGVPSDEFSVRWSGFVTIPASGTYRFRTLSDDGARLWVDGTLRIEQWSDHSSASGSSAPLAFSAGQRIPVTLEYYERGGNAEMRLQWQKPGSKNYVAIPLGNLSPE